MIIHSHPNYKDCDGCRREQEKQAEVYKALKILLEEVEWLAANGEIDAGYVPYEALTLARTIIPHRESNG